MSIDVLNLIKDRERPAPAFTFAQVPDRPALEKHAIALMGIYGELRLETPEGPNAELAEALISSDEQELNDQVDDLLRQVPELEQYLSHQKGSFGLLNALDRALLKAEGVNAGLCEDLGSALLLLAARLTEHCDVLLGAGESLATDPGTPVAVNERVARHLYPAHSNLEDTAEQLRGRRQRDARRAQQRDSVVSQRQHLLETKERLAALRGGATADQDRDEDPGLH